MTGISSRELANAVAKVSAFADSKGKVSLVHLNRIMGELAYVEERTFNKNSNWVIQDFMDVVSEDLRHIKGLDLKPL